MLQDLRFAIRGFARTRGVTLLAILTLAVGVGANAAIFSVIHAVMIEPLPYPDADRLVMPRRNSPSMGNLTISPSRTDLEKWRAAGVFESMASYTRLSMVMAGQDEPEQLAVARVDVTYLDFAGSRPALGRSFTSDDAASEASARVALLTDGLWRRRFGADRGVIGTRIELTDVPHEIVGVLPASFRMPMGSVDVVTPLPPPKAAGAHTFSTVSAIARLLPGVSVETAQEVLTAAGVEAIGEAKDWRVQLTRPTEAAGPTFRRALLVLFAAVGFVLLIACANVANLVLARNAARAREIAVRVALGAGRGRLVRQLLTENLLLAVAGGALGVALGVWGLQAILALRPADMRELQDLRLSWQMMAFGFAVAGVTGIVFGLYPALAGSRRDAADALRLGSRSAGDARGRIARRVLTVAEVALALVLLAGAGLLIRSYDRLQRVDLGFETERLIGVNVRLPESRYSTAAARAEFLKTFAARVQELQGVRQAALGSWIPPRGGMIFSEVEIEGRDLPSGQKPNAFGGGWVTPEYFQTLRIPIREGRGFAPEEMRKDANVVVINDAMATRYWPGESAVGKRIRFSQKSPWQVIVGVVGTVKTSHAEPGGLQMYYPLSDEDVFPDTGLVVATSGEPALILGAVKAQAWAIDPKLPLREVSTIEQRVAETLARPRFNLVLLSLFAAIGLLLAAIGIYGVISYSVGVRTREIGVRMALGALPADIRRAVLQEALVLAAVGAGLGIAGALALGRFMKALVFEVSASDPLTLGAVTVVLTLSAALAAWVPARRATRVDPMVALRAE